jgi:hypothetical protein
MATSPAATATRAVSIPLFIGIALMPYIFVWFLIRKGHSTVARVLGFGWLAIVLLMVARAGHAPIAPGASSSETSAPSSQASDGTSWQYSEEVDQMRGGKERRAQVESTNQLSFDFPYGGGSTGSLIVRQSPKFGFDIMVRISKGQFVCHQFTGGHISVKFDDGPIQKFGCTDAADGSSNVIFLEGAKRFLAELKRSKRAVIEAEFFREGVRQMEFNTAGLNW